MQTDRDIKWGWVVLAVILILTIAVLWHSNTTDYTATEVEQRTAIEKLTDNVAVTWTELQGAELEHAKTGVALDEALQGYNEAIDYLNAFTR